METARIDSIDREILAQLMRNARMTYRELGDRVSLSANAAAERVRRLREQGVIEGFRAVVDPAATGCRLAVLIDVRLASSVDRDRFERLVESLGAVIHAVPVTGRFDYQLRAACRDSADLDTLLRALKVGGVAEAETRIALRTVVDRQAPLASA